MINPISPQYRGLCADGTWAYGRLTIVDDGQASTNKIEAGYYISNHAGALYAYNVIPKTAGVLTLVKDALGGDVYVGDQIETETVIGKELILWTVGIGANGCFVCTSPEKPFGIFYLNTIAAIGIVVGNIHEPVEQD